MIQSIHIQNFKSIENQVFDFKPLTILTGANSSGKSSVIQAILLYSHYTARREENYKADSLKKYIGELGDPKTLAYKKAKEDRILIQPTINNKNEALLYFDISSGNICLVEVQKEQMLIFEQDLYFISANRTGQENRPQSSRYEKCGVNGEYIFGFYQKNQNNRMQNERLIYKKKLDNDLKPPAESLSAQVSLWLRKILNLDLIPNAEAVDDSQVKLKYKNMDLSKKYDSANMNDDFNMSPFNLGTGVSYLAKILILGLSLKEGDILIVENPEVHLHPKAISNFAEFFMFLVNGGIQVILETHSENIVNKMRYFVFNRQISKDDIQIYYRERFDKPFDSIRINDKGKYINIDDEIIEFPTGFFDSDLDELLEMM